MEQRIRPDETGVWDRMNYTTLEIDLIQFFKSKGFVVSLIQVKPMKRARRIRYTINVISPSQRVPIACWTKV